jgi:hypothetical protein
LVNQHHNIPKTFFSSSLFSVVNSVGLELNDGLDVVGGYVGVELDDGLIDVVGGYVGLIYFTVAFSPGKQ